MQIPDQSFTTTSSITLQLSRAIFSESKAGYRWAGASLLAFFVVLALAFAIVGPPPVAGGRGTPTSSWTLGGGS